MASERQHFDRVKFWCNRANDAWAMGEADWVKDSKGHDVPSAWVVALFELHQSWEIVADLLMSLCKNKGIDPKRHKWHGRG
jgi:hypothetical protein